jgi:C1A family cysteine protease
MEAIGFGWRRDLPDNRDYTPRTLIVEKLLARLPRPREAELPTEVDMREFFPEPYDQGKLHSSTSQACVGLVEYYQRRCSGNQLKLSRLFHHQVTCTLLGQHGNAGTDLRSGMKSIPRFGLPPEKYWHYDAGKLDTDPTAQLFSFADSYRAIVYVRLDRRNSTGRETLQRVKAFLAANIPVAFGLSVPSSYAGDGIFSYRPEFAFPVGGQTMVAVGYNDDEKGVTGGSLLVRNSWGPKWGERGYAWVPYQYVTEQLAVDFWTMLRKDWVDSGELSQPMSFV